MADFEVHVDLNGRTYLVGIAHRNLVRGAETILFEYASEWLSNPDRFALEPALALTRGTFPPRNGQSIFGSLGDSAPDTWGRRLMQRSERDRRNGKVAPFEPCSKAIIFWASRTRHALAPFVFAG